MASSVKSDKQAEPYATEVGGRSIKCESLADALALKIAEHAAREAMRSAYDPLPAERLIEVARKYGFDAIATAIENR